MVNENNQQRSNDMPGHGAVWQRPVNFFLPTVVRCMEERYVDAFLQRGELRLSSFSAFAKHRDEQRGDAGEGKALVFRHDTAQQKVFGIFGTVGTQAYVLSTMLYASPDLRTALGGACFEIGNVDQFACAIGNELAGCVGIDVGFCVYEDTRILQGAPIDLPPDRFQDNKDPAKYSMEKIAEAARTAQGPRQMFIKHPRYSHQCEYRFIWHINRPTRDYIDIVLPSLLPSYRKI